MRAIVIEKFGGPDSLVYTELPEPEPEAGYVVIQIKAFGLNHAEMHMRRGEWAEAAKVSGIECVGVVKACPGGEFPIGAKVAALMGGLGRTINGSYAEYTRARVSNVALIESDLPWAELAAIPETYATAWTCLFRNLEIARGQTLVIRGGGSSFGRAAINMAVNAGVRVITTARSKDNFAALKELRIVLFPTRSSTASSCLASGMCLERSHRSISTRSVPFPQHAPPWRSCLSCWLARWPRPDRRF
jgi:NADPH2:quinone reductase